MKMKFIFFFLLLYILIGISVGNTPEKVNLIEEALVINDIPVRIYYKNDNCKKELLLLSHGFRGNKENWSEKMIVLAEMGFYTVSFDNRYHGERKGMTISEKVFNDEGKISVLALRKVIDETALDVSELIDYFEENANIKKSKVGMMGISLGGFITYASLVRDDRIAFAVPLISSPFWDDIPKNPVFLNSNEAEMELKEYAKMESPGNRVEKFTGKKILAMIGMNDNHFNVGRVIDFYKELNEKFDPERKDVILKTYDVGHEVNEEMWGDVLKWLSNIE